MIQRLLLLEDDAERAERILHALSGRYECHWSATIEDAAHVLPEGRWAAVVVDYRPVEGGSGFELLQVVRESLPKTFRVFCAQYFKPVTLQGMRCLAAPHLVVDAADPGLAATIRRGLDDLLVPPTFETPEALPPITEDAWVAHSPVTVRFLAELREAAEGDAPVYVYGEPGSGRTRAAITLRTWREDWKARGSPGAGRGTLPVAAIRVPALRERPQGMPVIVARILLEDARRTGEEPCRVSARALEELLSREWPGNIVELAGVLGRARQRLGGRTVIELGDLPSDSPPRLRPSQFAKDEGQRQCLLRQLRMARTVSAAARLEGCTRANYIRLMRRLGIIRADVAMDREVVEPDLPMTL